MTNPDNGDAIKALWFKLLADQNVQDQMDEAVGHFFMGWQDELAAIIRELPGYEGQQNDEIMLIASSLIAVCAMLDGAARYHSYRMTFDNRAHAREAFLAMIGMYADVAFNKEYPKAKEAMQIQQRRMRDQARRQKST